MLISDFRVIGNKLYAFRKSLGLTQAEVAESAGISDRTYADIERGSVNMRMETFLSICRVLKATPDEILTDDREIGSEEIVALLESVSGKKRRAALRILESYLKNA